MTLTGISDEAGATLASQIAATTELGWRHIEMRGVQVPGFPKANFHDIPEPAFHQAVDALANANLQVCCFGSTIMNWAKRVEDPFDITIAEVQRAIPRMQLLGCRLVRIMSFKPADDTDRIPREVFHRVREVTQRFLDAGIQPVHENCMNYGGMSWKHALELLDKVPGLKWVFDTANPVFNPDRSRAKPWPQQDAWEFWTHIRDYVAHIHIKDARWNPARKDADYTWPGEGQGYVREILADALARRYSGAVSIEPHMVVVFHDAGSQASEDNLRANYVDYGRRLARLLDNLRTP